MTVVLAVICLLILAAILDRGKTIGFLGGAWSFLVVVFWTIAGFAAFAWARSSGWI